MPNFPAGRFARKQLRCLAFFPTVWMHNTGGRVRCRCIPLSGRQSTGVHRAADEMHLASLRVWIPCLLLKMEQQERLWMALCTLDWPRFISGSVPPRVIGNVGVYRLNRANKFQWQKEAQLFASGLHPQTSLPKSCFPQLRCPELLRRGLRRGFPGRQASSALQTACRCQRAKLSLCQALPALPGLSQRTHCSLLLRPRVACGSFSVSSGSLRSHLQALFWKKKNIFRSLYFQNQKVINWTGCLLPMLSRSLLFYDTPNRHNSSIWSAGCHKL